MRTVWHWCRSLLSSASTRAFRHKVLGMLRRRGLLSPERIELLLSWKRSGI